jgi:ABC-type amino acid transport substrate-binding protein
MRLLPSLIFFLFSSLANARPLTVSTPDWPPFFIQDRMNDRGMGWEILATCGSAIEPSLSFDVYPIRRMFKYMERGDLDLNIMSFKEDRTKTLSYGKEVVFENTYGVWLGTHVKKNIRRITDMNDLSVGQLVGLRPSDQFRNWFDNRIKEPTDKEAIVLNDADQVVKMLASQRLDATVISGAEIRWRMKKLGLSGKIKDARFPIKSQEYFFVVSKQSPFFKKNPLMVQQLDRCVRSMKSSGKWQELRKQYDL